LHANAAQRGELLDHFACFVGPTILEHGIPLTVQLGNLLE
jgi:hypothetical protein